MVSKSSKRTLPLRNITNRRRQQQRKKKTPIKNITTAATVVVASINKSIYTCHRRLIKIFTKLVRIATPKKSSKKKKGYQILKKFPAGEYDHDISALRRSLFPETNTLPPLINPEKRTVFLDLDETLVHSKSDPPPEKYDFIVRPVIDGERINFYVLKRPFVTEFLECLSKNYEIVVFTAGIEEYASLVLDRLDWKGVISHRLYRDSCTPKDGIFVKDLSGLGRDLNKVVIVDDNPNSYGLQPENAIPIPPFVDNMEDGELGKLMEFFNGGCDGFDDMRVAVKNYLENGKGEKV